MAQNELYFTALGPSGSGKTTLLACMHEHFEELLPGSFYPADDKTYATLKTAYKNLKAAADDANSLEFENTVENTDELREYAFNIKIKNANLPVRFFDFPGIWLNPFDEEQSINHKQVINVVSKSSVILVAINTPYIIDFNGRYKDYAGIDEIEHAIKMSLQNNSDEKLILFIPIKSECYTMTHEGTLKLLKCVEDNFAKTIKLADNPNYKDRFTMLTALKDEYFNLDYDNGQWQNNKGSLYKKS